ncbi:MAG TPA: flagellar hook-associated protein FlgK [Roseiarcus sp.]|jgi:flagellar hook-associated protein 1 FlgK
MSLSSTYNIISSAFASTAAQTSVISNNIANANTPGYNRQVANVVTTSYGGSQVVSVTREANNALLDQVNASTSLAAAQQAVASGLTTLAATVDDSASSTSSASQNGNSPSATLSNLESALATYQSSPNSQAAGQAVVSAASELASSLNTGTSAVQQVREQADSGMAASVTTINSLLNQYAQADAAVVNGTASGANVSTAENTRDSLLTQLSQQIGVSTTNNPNGSVSIFTDSGVPLYQTGVVSQLSFTASPTLVAGTSGNPVTVNGVAITGPSAPMAIQSGALAGLSTLRDTVAPQYQSQLDQIANGVINAFAETDQTGGGNPAMPGLFTYPGATGVPSSTTATGLAGLIEVNPAVDPSQGGNVSLLQNGGINGANYVYNTTGVAGYTGRIQGMISSITATQAFDPSAGLGSSASLSSYASSSVGWVQGQNQQASNAVTYENSVVTQATAALNNATGVNLDTELTNMLTIENTYTTTAKLLTTVGAMFNALISATN